jgi:hypothetical protein
MDAVHPEYQSQAVCGWMPKGETKTLAATNTQYRLHLNGAIDLNTMQIITREYPTIDALSIISFCTCQARRKNAPFKSTFLTF